MKPTARLYGGPKDGELLTLEESVPYELVVPVSVALRQPDTAEATTGPLDEDAGPVVITGSIVYRRRGDHFEALNLGEPVPYEFVGPVKRGSRR